MFTTGSDPIRDGLVTSMSRPGGNMTGVVFITATLGPKRLELLRQFVPKATKIAMLVNPGTPETDAERNEVTSRCAINRTAGRCCRSPQRQRCRSSICDDGLAPCRCGAGRDRHIHGQRSRPACCISSPPCNPYDVRPISDSAEAGGLMAYAASMPDAYHQAGLYTGQILKGEKAGLIFLSCSPPNFIS